MIAAAILASGFVAAQRQPLSGGVLEDSLKEKYVEFLGFIRAQSAAEKAASKPAAKKSSGRGTKKKK